MTLFIQLVIRDNTHISTQETKQQIISTPITDVCLLDDNSSHKLVSLGANGTVSSSPEQRPEHSSPIIYMGVSGL